MKTGISHLPISFKDGLIYRQSRIKSSSASKKYWYSLGAQIIPPPFILGSNPAMP